jgi:hypothetical protein
MAVTPKPKREPGCLGRVATGIGVAVFFAVLLLNPPGF